MAENDKNSKRYVQAAVHQSLTIAEVLSHMNCEAAMIVDDDKRLCGLLTDGDIRRAFLAGATLETPVSQVMTRNPIAIKIGEEPDPAQLLKLMLEKKIRHIPVIDRDERPLGLELLKEQYDEENLEAVLMAGGKGTRLRPLTFEKPKPLIKVGEKPIIDTVLAGLRNSGVSDVAISVNYLGDMIKQHIQDGSEFELNIGYLEEKQALGTAGALSLLKPRPQKSFIVMNADLITDVDYKALARFHREEGNDFSVCVRKIKHSVPYGVVSLSGQGTEISSISEKPEFEYLVNAGIYMLEPEIIDLIPENIFFDMVSLVKKAKENGFKTGAFPIYEYWRDIGQHTEMQAAQKEVSEHRAAEPKPTAGNSRPTNKEEV